MASLDFQIAQNSSLAISLGAVCDLLIPVHLSAPALVDSTSYSAL